MAKLEPEMIDILIEYTDHFLKREENNVRHTSANVLRAHTDDVPHLTEVLFIRQKKVNLLISTLSVLRKQKHEANIQNG